MPRAPARLRRRREVRHARLPARVGGEGEPEIGFAAQKQYPSFHVLRTDVMAAHHDRLTGLERGKGCVRYRRPDQLDEAVVSSILAMTATTVGPVC